MLVRYGHEPRRVPPTCRCDGRTPFTLAHAHSLTCATGGGVIGRHNMLVDELSHLCATATTNSPFSCVHEEWLVRPGERGYPNGLRSETVRVRVRGLNEPGEVMHIDARVCYPAAASHIVYNDGR